MGRKQGVCHIPGCPELTPCTTHPTWTAGRGGSRAWRRTIARELQHKPACTYCGAPATTLDHATPVSKGGADEPANRVPACRSCNARKGTKTAAEYIAWRKENA